jgi:hypothetical protein
MVKKGLLGTVMIGFLLTGCSGKDNPIVLGEELPEGFEPVSQIVIESSATYEIKHKTTGCHYILSANVGGITQMFTEDGKPHCTK